MGHSESENFSVFVTFFYIYLGFYYLLGECGLFRDTRDFRTEDIFG